MALSLIMCFTKWLPIKRFKLNLDIMDQILWEASQSLWGCLTGVNLNHKLKISSLQKTKEPIDNLKGLVNIMMALNEFQYATHA